MKSARSIPSSCAALPLDFPLAIDLQHDQLEGGLPGGTLELREELDEVLIELPFGIFSHATTW